jgi:hypothetical protein
MSIKAGNSTTSRAKKMEEEMSSNRHSLFFDGAAKKFLLDPAGRKV